MGGKGTATDQLGLIDKDPTVMGNLKKKPTFSPVFTSQDAKEYKPVKT